MVLSLNQDSSFNNSTLVLLTLHRILEIIESWGGVGFGIIPTGHTDMSFHSGVFISKETIFISKTKFSSKKPFFQACLWSIDQRLTFGFGKSENKLQFKVLEFAEQVLDAALSGLHKAGSPVWGVGLKMGFHFSHEAFDVSLEFTLFQSHWGHAESIDNRVNGLIAIIDIVNWHGITNVIFGCTFSDHF